MSLADSERGRIELDSTRVCRANTGEDDVATVDGVARVVVVDSRGVTCESAGTDAVDLLVAGMEVIDSSAFDFLVAGADVVDSSAVEMFVAYAEVVYSPVFDLVVAGTG